jgi:uncharacterized membrane protein YfcA
MSELWWLVPAFFVIALLYASVGHGGASGYLAALSFVAWHPDAMSTTALTLNVVVAGLGLAVFARAGHFAWRVSWPFLVASIPAAFLGGSAPVSERTYAVLLAVPLGVAAARLVMPLRGADARDVKPPTAALAVPVGAAVGWLSGVVGIGGGIFLSPLLILGRWADPKQAAASSACFILANSAAGLLGRLTQGSAHYGMWWPLLAAACAGGLVGARLGANHFSGALLKRLLAVALVVAAVKLFSVAVG